MNLAPFRSMVLAGSLVGSLLAGSAAANAAELDVTLVFMPFGAAHAPGADGLVGTPDDFVSAAGLPPAFSAPNAGGALSYNAFDFGPLAPGSALPAPYDAVTFLAGSVSVDTDVAAVGGGPLVTGFSVTGTEPFPGHGPYTAATVAINGGTYDPVTHAMTLDIDFTASLLAGTADAVSFVVSGLAVYVPASDFGVATGIPYVDAVLVPMVATPLGADGLFFAAATGVVPASTGGSGGSFPAMPVAAVLVGVHHVVPVPMAFALLPIPVAWLLARRRLTAAPQ